MIVKNVKPALGGGFFLFLLTTPMILAGCIWIVFGSALPGQIQFDDKINLSGLAEVNGISSAWEFIRAGHAGPLGRPLSLLTFALQAYQWPLPAAFLEWNIALHAINALLMFWLAMLVVKHLNSHLSSSDQISASFMVALLWAMLPLLNSSVLFIVQRMALLSGTFILTGLVSYLKLRGPADAGWWRQWAAVSTLGAFGVLALLSKETGALIVVYALVLELALFTTTRARLRNFALLILLLANAMLLVALLRYVDWSACVPLQRGFTLAQRLGSQGVLLPTYLQGLFLPTSAALNPFRFESLLRDLPQLRWGIVLWAALMLSPLLTWWRGWRLAALTLAWFFYGHILESGWLSLEPYFAHRNYLPAAGLVFALVYTVFLLRQNVLLLRSALAIYILLLVGVTWMNMTLWGNNALAAEMWAKQEPRSVRAALNLGYELERTQGLSAAQHYLDQFVVQGRDSAGLRLQGLVSACVLNPETNHSSQVDTVVHAIATLPYEGWASDLVAPLMEKVRTQGCTGVSLDQVAEIAAAFLNRPAYQCSRPVVHNMLAIVGLVAIEHGDIQNGMLFYWQALKESMTYAMASFYLDLAQKQGNLSAIAELHALLKTSAVPREATKAEWQALLERAQEVDKK